MPAPTPAWRRVLAGTASAAALFAWAPQDPVDVHNRAVDALRRGDLREAQSLGRSLVATDDDHTLPHAHALLGFVALRRAEQAYAQASGPEAEPFAMDAAIDYGERARDEWVTAIARRAESGGDLPAVRRNVERLMRMLAQWRRERDANRPEALREKDRARINPKLIPRANEAAQQGTKPEQERAAGQDDPDALDADGVQRYLQLLEQKREERRATRAATRSATSRTVEKDW